MAFLQALELKPNYALAYILKGSLVLADGNVEAAPKHFLQATNIRKDIYSYKGEVTLRDSEKVTHREKDGEGQDKWMVG